jgi:pimeloyl-ACP methyl ester carboxylesterase
MPLVTVAGAQIEFQRIAVERSRQSSPIVMLHEGLGCIALWKDFPLQLAQATARDVLLYSRQGYGHSSALVAARTVRYMHHEALQVLPQLLDRLGIVNPILFGHSDGGSIALIHAGGSQRAVAGVVVLAPHVLVEDISVSSIAAARVAYETTDLRARLERHHDDVDGMFWGWNDIWLHPAFRAWNIEDYVKRIRCGILAIQGEQDEYGTMDQIDRIARLAPDVRTLSLPNCRHSPHRDQPRMVLESVVRWIEEREIGADGRGVTVRAASGKTP